VNTHGLKGELKVVPWSDSPDTLAELSRVFIGSDEYKITSAKVHGGLVIMKLDGVDGVDAAIRLKGKVLLADRSDFELEDGSFFVQDVLGFPVFDESGTLLGELADILPLPASDVFVVRGADSAERLIPNVPEFVKLVDVENQRVVVAPIEGM
jgi:16S rRNA processing protein RimM